ncbi:hypothetical protein Dimus_014154 [Dionaea muscipula]
MGTEKPRRWRFTWETQSHIPILKLFVFNPSVNPLAQCNDLKFDLHFEKSLLNISWSEQARVSLAVPLPRVLVDLESPLNFRVSDDHIEVKLSLLLPVDHPIVSNFISDLLPEDEVGAGDSTSDFLQPLSMDSDAKSLSSEGDVHFYCRTCSFQLTRRPIRSFLDMPSVNWTEAADNWFGSCCCSFGGISERLVLNYVQSYACVEGSCLLNNASVILCKDDVVGCQCVGSDLMRQHGDHKLSEDAINLGVCHDEDDGSFLVHGNDATLCSPRFKKEMNDYEERKEDEQEIKNSSCAFHGHDFTDEVDPSNGCCTRSVSVSDGMAGLLADQKSFLNGYLGNVFIFQSPALSKEVEWIEFTCPQCSCLLGAYPSANGLDPSDGGIRLLKCYISTSLPVSSSGDLFRKYKLEKMFANHLLESATNELSFQTGIRDLKSGSMMMRITILNPDSWCCSGYCFESYSAVLFQKVNLHPVIKVLFSNCCDNPEIMRNSDEGETKRQADEVFMLKPLIKELIRCLDSTGDTFPSSFSSSRGFILSSIHR